MKYIDEYRNNKLIKKISEKIKAVTPFGTVNIMEVCGTHTQSFFRFGVDRLLPGNMRLISGPGCPVCVSPQGYIDSAIWLAGKKGAIIVTFGDMLRIPGSKTTLEKERANGAKVHVVYSALDSLKIARANPKRKVVFLAVGFETTAPTIGLSIIAAKRARLNNLSFLSALKLIPPAMKYLVSDKRLNLAGFLCPGHVSSIIGLRPYEFIPKKYGIPCCVAGFEPLDILEAVFMILKQIKENKPRAANQYTRAVKRGGNLKAQNIIAGVFKPTGASWRGLGDIPGSGLKIRDEYSGFDAEKVFSLKLATSHGPRATKCRCGDVLKGLITPLGCPLFSKACSPDNPIGPCMVSNEGACSAYYRYK